jgi:hypothetical protein
MRALPSIALLPLAALLAACSTPQERAAYMQAQAAEMMTVYGPACTRLGYAANTDPWRSCIVNLSTKEELRSSLNSSYYYGPGYYRGGGFWGPYW